VIAGERGGERLVAGGGVWLAHRPAGGQWMPK
jgi:hypothetical protein